MKCLTVLSMLLFMSTVNAQELVHNDGTVFVTTDESISAKLCLAALESREALEKKVKDLEVGHRTLKKVTCNDMSLVKFAKTHRDDMREWAIATVQ